MPNKMAILVDGGFYLKRAKSLRGKKSPEERAKELFNYCRKHAKHENANIYRIFYYDCDPIDKKAYHPLHDRTFDLRKSEEYAWKNEFFNALAHYRKVALRKGQELASSCQYILKPSVGKDIVRGKREISSLTDSDFCLDIQQKGVDVRIGLDIALIANNRFANQVVLVTGDSDFVPAAKYARRNGIDFIIDPMWHDFRSDLSIHTDGMYSPWNNPRKNKSIRNDK